jgi:hypothetical protein
MHQHTDCELFPELRCFDDICTYISDAYRQANQGQKLALAVAEPGELMLHAVRLAGSDGLARAIMERDLFWSLGKQRFARGITQLNASGEAEARKEFLYLLEPRVQVADGDTILDLSRSEFSRYAAASPGGIGGQVRGA